LDGYQRYSAPIIIAVGHTFSDTFSTTVLLKALTQKITHFVTLCSGHRLSEGFSFSEDIDNIDQKQCHFYTIVCQLTVSTVLHPPAVDRLQSKELSLSIG
jgi:hypothetical protein